MHTPEQIELLIQARTKAIALLAMLEGDAKDLRAGSSQLTTDVAAGGGQALAAVVDAARQTLDNLDCLIEPL